MSLFIKSRSLFIGIAVLLVIIGLFFVRQFFQEEEPPEKLTEPQPVGLNVEPDSLGWRPLFNGQNLAGWKVTNFGPQGPVRVNESDETLILKFGDGCTGVTWKQKFPEVNYEIALDAKRVMGNDFFCGLTFPVQDEYCTLIVGGWGGAVVGISSIDGKDASENFTTRLMSFEKGKWYPIRLRVTEKKICAWINEKQIIEVQVDEHQFTVRPEVRLSKPLGICSWMTTAALRNLRFITIPKENLTNQ